MILVTGFEPFGGLARNPSGEIAKALAGRKVRHAVLPVDYGGLESEMAELCGRSWTGALMLGVDPKGVEFAVERVAINYRDPDRPDSTGEAPTDAEIVPGGTAAYFTTLEPKTLVRSLRQAGLPARESLSAGAYLCNASYYLALSNLGKRRVPCTFVHVPATPDMGTSEAPLEMEELVRGARVVLERVARADRAQNYFRS